MEESTIPEHAPRIGNATSVARRVIDTENVFPNRTRGTARTEAKGGRWRGDQRPNNKHNHRTAGRRTAQ